MALSSPEDVINLVLREIGYPRPISDIYEGSRASRVALDLYGQTRDEVLTLRTWSFARRDAGLVLLKAAPPDGYGATPWTNAYPPLPWKFEYAYPDDALQIQSVRPTPLFLPNWMPGPWVFRIINDTATGDKVIASDAPEAIATYTGRITDPTQWEDKLFWIAFVETLAKKMAPALGGSPDLSKMKIAEAAAALQEASKSS